MARRKRTPGTPENRRRGRTVVRRQPGRGANTHPNQARHQEEGKKVRHQSQRCVRPGLLPDHHNRLGHNADKFRNGTKKRKHVPSMRNGKEPSKNWGGSINHRPLQVKNPQTHRYR